MFAAGQTLSHYRLGEKIGQGGMGEVWKATDTRLGREVALKFLPEVVTHDQERLERFLREARFLATLNHPAIATIHDIDSHQGIRFLVMELVPGPDLAEVLEGGPLPPAVALDAALQIARAVEAAHDQGVVHRDLKPANVKRSPGGQVKVLDFGLAKVIGPETTSDPGSVSMSPTITSAGTVAGTILGTAAYMSPEQARGRPIDKRADIWSFGVLLYELLTGDNPFRGDTVADSVGAILHRTPDLDALPPGTPPAVRRLLRRCLARDRDDRLHDIADARIEIQEALGAPLGETPSELAAPRRPRLPWVALAVLLPLVALSAWWIGSRAEPVDAGRVRQFELAPEMDVDEVELSPDGTRLAYRIKHDVFIRSLDSLESRRISEGRAGTARAICWSPDGRSLGLLTEQGEIQRIDLDGGAPTILTSDARLADVPVWSDDGYIYFGRFQGGIFRLPESGGAIERILEAPGGLLDYHGIVILPGGHGILTIPHLQGGDPRKVFLDQPGRDSRVIFECDAEIYGLRFVSTGHLAYERGDNPRGLWAVPFSLDRLEVTGPPFLVVPDLSRASFSRSGDMAYTRAALQSGKRKQQTVWADSGGNVVERLDMPLYSAQLPVASPDGSKLAVIAAGVGRPSNDKPNLWVIDLQRKTATKLTEEGLSSPLSIWSADSTRVACLRNPDEVGGEERLVAVRADGTGDPETVLEANVTFFADLTKDWSRAAFITGRPADGDGLALAVQVPGDPSTRETFVDSPEQDVFPAIHPSGKWIAYASGDFTTMDTFVRPFPSGDGRWKASVDEGGVPFWSPDGRKLYFYWRDDDVTRLTEVEFDGSGPAPRLGTPRELFTVKTASRGIGIGPDGRFIYVIDEEPAEGEDRPDTEGIVFVENWLERFRH